LGGFYILAVVNNAAMKIHGHVFVWAYVFISFEVDLTESVNYIVHIYVTLQEWLLLNSGSFSTS